MYFTFKNMKIINYLLFVFEAVLENFKVKPKMLLVFSGFLPTEDTCIHAHPDTDCPPE